MNFDFFPSKRLAFYMAKLFLTRSLAVVLSLVLVLLALNLLSESGDILAAPGNGEGALWHYATLRAPQLFAFALPFSTLLGALIAFAALNQNSEVIAMKAAGISAHQIIAPMVLTSIAIAVLSFGFNEFVVTKSNRVLSAWQNNDYKPVPADSGISSNVWLTAGTDLIHARLVVRGPQGARRLEGLTIYSRPNGVEMQSVVSAERAYPVAGAWRLEQVKRYDSIANVSRFLPVATAMAGIDPERFALAKVTPDEHDFFDLRRLIAQLQGAGRATGEVEAGLWHKLAEPLSTVLMPLLAATAAFGLARSGKVLVRAAIGMALGFAYFVVDNFALALGNLGAYPPLLAAWAPFLLFLLIGEAVLVRSEE
ncbi:LPS export ABC transporter permease LptG [Sphingomonas ginkgonis]|uniref:LPS export ABC transporter permease LptG n=1 Tax=Sphingomonas ginkgonis TaxID=2315330 RepID=A0A3R9Z8H7_9SPHN|nr:LPS export ABC transporter permease LptG [Sphingomonas ginkgonis]